jgi:HSP20 family protein
VSSVLMRTDPFREFDRAAQQWFNTVGTAAHPASMPMDAYRDGEMLFLHFDVPGIDPDSLTLEVQRNVLTVGGERKSLAPEDASWTAAERPSGSFRRPVFLGESLDPDRIAAHYEAGVLKVSIPVVETAKPRRVQISGTVADSTSQLTH